MADEATIRILAIEAARRAAIPGIATLLLMRIHDNDTVDISAKPASGRDVSPQIRKWAQGHTDILALVKTKDSRVFRVHIPSTMAADA